MAESLVRSPLQGLGELKVFCYINRSCLNGGTVTLWQYSIDVMFTVTAIAYKDAPE